MFAAVAKVRNPVATRASFRDLGVPRPDASAVGVPVVECLIALGLVFVPVVGVLAALAMLAAFTAFLGVHLARGSDIGCGCFGATAAEPISSVSIVRNGMLMLLALLALCSTDPVLPGFDAIVFVSIAVLLGTTLLAVLDLRRKGTPLWRIERGMP